MFCTNCGFHNLPTSDFCAECGASLGEAKVVLQRATEQDILVVELNDEREPLEMVAASQVVAAAPPPGSGATTALPSLTPSPSQSCPRCSFQNLPTSDFCAECGASLSEGRQRHDDGLTAKREPTPDEFQAGQQYVQQARATELSEGQITTALQGAGCSEDIIQRMMAAALWATPPPGVPCPLDDSEGVLNVELGVTDLPDGIAAAGGTPAPGTPASVRQVVSVEGEFGHECARCGWPLEVSHLPERCPQCGRRLDGEEPVIRRRSHRGLVSAAAAIIVLALLAWYASGAPSRATRKAFEQLAAADAKGIAAPQVSRVVSVFQTDDPARREGLVRLDKVMTDMGIQYGVGGWVQAGRFLRNAAALGTPPEEMLAALKTVRNGIVTAQSPQDAERAFRALETIAKRYSSSRSRLEAAIASLGTKLGVQPEEKAVITAVDNRYQQLVAREKAAEAARQKAAQDLAYARDQARQAQQAQVRTRPTGGRHWELCTVCRGSGRCTSCNGTGQIRVINEFGHFRFIMCPDCEGTGVCQVCGGLGKIMADDDTYVDNGVIPGGGIGPGYLGPAGGPNAGMGDLQPMSR